MVKDIALNEITLRKYERPYNLDERELVKKICLSLGLLQPGDSRDVIVDIFLILIEASKNKEKLNSEQIRQRVEKIRKEKSLGTRGLAESNIRRQLKRLRDLMIIEKKENLYHIAEFETLMEIFEKKIVGFQIPQIIERIKEYLQELEKNNSNH